MHLALLAMSLIAHLVSPRLPDRLELPAEVRCDWLARSAMGVLAS